MTRTFFPRGKFPRRNSVLKWVPRSIACKLDLANCTRECRSIPSNLIFQGLSRSSVDPWQVRANKFFHDQSYYTGSLCNVITSSYYIPIRYLSLEPPTVEPAAIDWFALPFCTLRPFSPLLLSLLHVAEITGFATLARSTFVRRLFKFRVSRI